MSSNIQLGVLVLLFPWDKFIEGEFWFIFQIILQTDIIFRETFLLAILQIVLMLIPCHEGRGIFYYLGRL